MDGTGVLFRPFLQHYQGETHTVKLPTQCKQDYNTLALEIEKQLPDEPLILLAESFSGGLVAPLLDINMGNIQGLIFVSSFITPPSKPLIKLARHLPIKLMLSLPTPHFVYRALFLGQNASADLIMMFIQAVKSVPEAILKMRLQSIARLRPPAQPIVIPSVYIQASDDRLVPQKQFCDLKQSFPETVQYTIRGPHFILQAEPKPSALAASKAVAHITKSLD